VGGAPAVKGQRSAVVAQKFGVQGLEERERFQARGEALLPRRRAASAPAVRARSTRANDASRLRVRGFIVVFAIGQRRSLRPRVENAVRRSVGGRRSEAKAPRP